MKNEILIALHEDNESGSLETISKTTTFKSGQQGRMLRTNQSGKAEVAVSEREMISREWIFIMQTSFFPPVFDTELFVYSQAVQL
jgi:hypothetical protein